MRARERQRANSPLLATIRHFQPDAPVKSDASSPLFRDDLTLLQLVGETDFCASFFAGTFRVSAPRGEQLAALCGLPAIAGFEVAFVFEPLREQVLSGEVLLGRFDDRSR